MNEDEEEKRFKKFYLRMLEIRTKKMKKEKNNRITITDNATINNFSKFQYDKYRILVLKRKIFHSMRKFSKYNYFFHRLLISYSQYVKKKGLIFMKKIFSFDLRIKAAQQLLISNNLRKLKNYSKNKIKNNLLEIKIRKIKFILNSKYFFRVALASVNENRVKYEKYEERLKCFLKKMIFMKLRSTKSKNLKKQYFRIYYFKFMSKTKNRINTYKRKIDSREEANKMYLQTLKKIIFELLKSNYQLIFKSRNELKDKYLRLINPSILYIYKKSFFNLLQEKINRKNGVFKKEAKIIKSISKRNAKIFFDNFSKLRNYKKEKGFVQIFHQKKLKKKYALKLLYYHMYILEIKKKNVVSLIFWRNLMFKKVIKSFKIYKEDKTKSKNEYNRVSDERNLILSQFIIKSIISKSSQEIDKKDKFVVNFFIQKSLKGFLTARRWFIKLRNLVSLRKINNTKLKNEEIKNEKPIILPKNFKISDSGKDYEEMLQNLRDIRNKKRPAPKVNKY